jgi:uncharacterized protein (DUF1015 family)
MASIRPFRALRPKPELASRIAAVPYDVVSTDEARALAAANELSFLHVSRAEIDLPSGTNPYADEVYRTASGRFAWLRDRLVEEQEGSLYLYRLRMDGREQTGLAAGYSLDEYARDIIKKHERTRPDKEDDRTRHMIALGAQTGPVFLIYRARADIDAMAARATQSAPLYDFVADDGIAHTIWRVAPDEARAFETAFARVPSLYIADGHHRAASAARARDSGGAPLFLGVAFPDTQVQILPYNRIVSDLAGLTPAALLDALRATFVTRPAEPSPSRKGDVSIFVDGGWHTIALRADAADDAIQRLDVTRLQEQVLGPILHIGDQRVDKRIDFIGGQRGTGELERLVREGRAAAAFSLHPVSVDDLMRIADAGQIMPPKSTWFEPKLRDGLLILT